MDIRKKIAPIEIILLLNTSLLFLLIEYFFQPNIGFWKNKPLAMSTNYWQVFYIPASVVISYLITRKNNPHTFIIPLIIILVTNTTVLFLSCNKNNNNFIAYNLGNIDYKRYRISDGFTMLADTNIKSMMNAIVKCNNSREKKIRDLQGPDIISCGHGIKIFYKNKLGINYCNVFIEHSKISLCKLGYKLSIKEIKQFYNDPTLFYKTQNHFINTKG